MKKRLLSVTTLLLCLITLPLGVFADSGTSSYTTNGEHTTKVTALVSSTFTVKLPAAIELEYDGDSGLYIANYSVQVKANITNEEYISVVPQPGAELVLKEDSTKKAALNSDQPKTFFANSLPETNNSKYMALVDDEFVLAPGTLSADLKYAGAYEGNYIFDISMEDFD